MEIIFSEIGVLKEVCKNDMSEKGRRIWLTIGERDCVAMEVRYHMHCYDDYTKAYYNMKRAK